MSESVKRTWDSERAALIILEEIEVNEDVGQAVDKLTELLGSVREEAIKWAWENACQQHDQGRDPRRQEITSLLDRARGDLNPDRE